MKVRPQEFFNQRKVVFINQKKKGGRNPLYNKKGDQFKNSFFN